MPLSRGNHISGIIEEIKWCKPQSLLDVGLGWGLMGVIFRAYMDAGSLNDWGKRIDGIEIFENYRSKCWDFYNNVYIGNALEVIDTLDKYDVIYCGDMIEHMEKEEGYKLIDKMLEHCHNWVYIATPSPAPKQDAVFGNPYEEHKSSWVEEDFKRYKYEFVGSFNSGRDSMLCVRINPQETN